MGRIGAHGVFDGPPVEDYIYVKMDEIRKSPAMWGIKDTVQQMILDGFGVKS